MFLHSHSISPVAAWSAWMQIKAAAAVNHQDTRQRHQLLH